MMDSLSSTLSHRLSHHPSAWIRLPRCMFAFLLLSLAAPPLPSLAMPSASSGLQRPTHLETDALTEPLGLDTPNPLLSWQLKDARQGARQTAYEVGVFSKPPATQGAQPDVWDSRRVEVSTSTGVAYAGPALEPSKRYFWRVTVWDAKGRPYPVSEVSWWETGLLAAEQLACRVDRG